MISTRNIITDLNDVPREWVFEYYLNLKERLTGQDVKILSVFNAKDKVPSMFIYFDVTNDKYKYKDFSSGYQGDHISLVCNMFNLTVKSAIPKIMADYSAYLADNNVTSVVEYQYHDKFKVVDYEIRHWTNLDQAYWGAYKIGSKLLEHYNVSPLEFYVMEKTELDGSINSIKINKKYIYGYFRSDGSLYKIYMPKNLDKKFIKVENYTQGADQLRHWAGLDHLMITSSLKDLMAFRKLGIPGYQVIAPDSENSMLSKEYVDKLRLSFKKIVVLFDNDEPGINAAKKYKERYGLDYIILDMEKDLSDSVKAHGIIKVKEKLISLLDELDISRKGV